MSAIPIALSHEDQNTFETLLEFAKKHHEVCGDCEGTGKIYNNADPTSGQWVECPYAEAIRKAEPKKGDGFIYA